MTEGFPPHVHQHGGQKGDPAVAKRYEEFAKHEKALKLYEKAELEVRDCEQALERAKIDLVNRRTELLRARRELDAVITPEGVDVVR